MDRIPAGVGALHVLLGVDGDDLPGAGRDEVGEVPEPGAGLADRPPRPRGQDALPPWGNRPAVLFKLCGDALLVRVADRQAFIECAHGASVGNGANTGQTVGCGR